MKECFFYLTVRNTIGICVLSNTYEALKLYQGGEQLGQIWQVDAHDSTPSRLGLGFYI